MGSENLDPLSEGFDETFQELSRVLVRNIFFCVEESCDASDADLELLHTGHIQEYE